MLRSERLAEQAAAAEHQEQAQAGHGGRQDDRQVDDRLDEPRSAERPPCHQPGERQTERHREHEADRGRDEAQDQGVEHDRGRERVGQRAVQDGASDQDGDRQPEEQQREAGDEPDGPPPEHGHVRPVVGSHRTPPACDPRRCAGVGAGCHGGGRKPNEDRTACPSGPGQPVEERGRRVLVRRFADDDARIGRRNVGRIRDLDRRDLVRCGRIGDIDDPCIAFAEFDLGHDCADVVLLRRHVRGVRSRKAGRGVRLLAARFATNCVAYFVIGTSSPAAMIQNPRLREIRRRLDSGRVVGRDDDGQLVAGERDRLTAGEARHRRASADWPCRPTGRRRRARPARSASRARTTSRSRS